MLRLWASLPWLLSMRSTAFTPEKRVLIKGSAGPTCPAEDDVLVTVYDDTQYSRKVFVARAARLLNLVGVAKSAKHPNSDSVPRSLAKGV